MNAYEWVILRLVRELMRKPGQHPEAIRALDWLTKRVRCSELEAAIDQLAKEK